MRYNTNQAQEMSLISRHLSHLQGLGLIPSKSNRKDTASPAVSGSVVETTGRMTRSMSKKGIPREAKIEAVIVQKQPKSIPFLQDRFPSIIEASADLQKLKGLQQIASFSSNASTTKKGGIKQEESDLDFEDFDYQGLKKEQPSDQSCSPKQEKSEPQRLKRKTKRGKERKMRQTITKEKLEQLNIYLGEFFQKRHQNKKPTMNLREIAAKINLSYSTTLHKAGVFRKNKEVKPGKFLSSLTKKRKYRKSYECEKYIELALKARPFYSAESLAKYILREFRVSYPRAIIGRHLNEMGYSSNNIKAFPLEKNGARCISLRRIYANLIEPLLINPALLIYVDEAAFSRNLFRVKTSYTPYQYDKQKRETEEDYVSVMVAMSSERIVYYHIRAGFYQKEDFVAAIAEIYSSCRGQIFKFHNNHMYLVSDMHKIHFDREAIAPCPKNPQEDSNCPTVESTLLRYGMRHIFLPPGSPQLNPVEIMINYLKNLLFSKREEIVDCPVLRERIVEHMRDIAREPTKRFFYEFERWFGKAKEGLPF